MIPLVYIASPSYSGSTLLTFLLNTHPRLATIGELKWGDIDLETYACSCGRLLRACSCWEHVATAVRGEGLPFDLARPPTDFRCRSAPFVDRIVRARVRGAAFEAVRTGARTVLPAARQAWPIVAAVNRAAIGAILAWSRADVFADASKDPVRLKHMAETGDYDIRVLHLVRDGRGVVNSAIKNDNSTPELAAREWVRTHRQVERLDALLSRDRRLVVRYEDLCRAPRDVMHEVFRFIGLEPIDVPPDYRAVEHHILGNKMRLRPHVEIRLDEKWRTTLAPSTLRVFERIGGAMNQSYGCA